MDEKRVYTFGNGKAEGKADMRNLLGGKGANLAEMNLIGVPVPPGFTITTDVCNEYFEKGKDDGPKMELKMPLTMVVASTNHQYSERRARPLTLVRLLSTLFTASLKPSLGVAT